MKGRWGKYLLGGLMVAVLAGCSSKPTDRGQQYKDGRLDQSLELVNQPNAKGSPVNAKDYSDQLMEIKYASPSLFNRNSSTYQAVQSWMASGADTRMLSQYGLSAYQMEGVDNYGNVQFTGYYTPVVQARYTQQGEFRYPLYRMPPKGRGRLPDRAGIYSGALDDRYIIAYTNSLMDNFMMEVGAVATSTTATASRWCSSATAAERPRLSQHRQGADRSRRSGQGGHVDAGDPSVGGYPQRRRGA